MMARDRKPIVKERSAAYRQLWRLVDGAVFDCFDTHPEYLTEKGKRKAREAINKRVVGTVFGYALEAKGRSVFGAAVARDTGHTRPGSRTARYHVVSKARTLVQGVLAAISWRCG